VTAEPGAYLFRAPCGCVKAVVVDFSDSPLEAERKITADALHEYALAGLKATPGSVEDARNLITFDCPHQQEEILF